MRNRNRHNPRDGQQHDRPNARRDGLDGRWNDPTELRMLRLALRRPGWIVLGLLLGVGAAAAYLRYATPLHTAAARLRVQQDDPQALGVPVPEHGIDQTTSFLNAELAVITSGPVLEMAVTQLTNTAAEFSTEMPAAVPTVPQLRKSIRAILGRKDGIITVQTDAPSPRDAEALVAAVVDAYVKYESQVRENTNQHLLDLLLEEREERAAQADATSARLAELLKTSGRVSVTDTRAADDLAVLKSSLRIAHQETVTAAQFFQEALGAISTDTELLNQFEQRRSEGDVAAPRAVEMDGGQVRAAIAGLEMELARLTRNRGAQHPQVLETQLQLKSLRVQYAAAAYARLAQARVREEDLSAAVRDQQARVPVQADQASQYAALEVGLRRQERQLDALEEKIVELKARKGSAGKNITVLDPAAASAQPTKPEKLPIMAMGVVAGLCFGVGAAWWREIRAVGVASASRRVRSLGGEPVEEREQAGRSDPHDPREPHERQEQHESQDRLEHAIRGGRRLAAPAQGAGGADGDTHPLPADAPLATHGQAQSRWVRRLENP